VFIFSLCGANGQEQNPPQNWNTFFHLPPSIEVPDWVKPIDWDHPNIYKIDSVLKAYNENKSDGPGEKKNQLREEAYRGVYLRWKKRISPFIQPDGSIVIDSTWFQKDFETSTEIARSKQMSKAIGNGNWTILGPTDAWNQGNGGKTTFQANVYRIAIAPTDNNVLYAGTETGAIFKSTNKGLNWQCVTDALPAASPMAIAVSPLNINVVFAYANGMLRSTNGGSTWFMQSSTYTAIGSSRILFNPISGRVFSCGSTSVYYSDDNGSSTWRRSAGNTVGQNMYDIAINPADPNTLYAVSASPTDQTLRICISKDAGKTFTTVNTGFTDIKCYGARLAVSPANSNYVYCVTLDSGSPKVLRSTDAGNTWEVTASSTNTDFTGGSGSTGLEMSNGQGYYDLMALASPLDANSIIVGTTSAYKSTDGGYNFSPLGGYLGPIPLHPDMQGAAAIGNDAYICTDGGVNYSSDFFSTVTNTSPRNYGITASEFWGFDQGWDQDIVVGGRYHNGNITLYDKYGSGAGLRVGGAESATGFVFHGTSNTVGFDDMGTFIVPNAISGTAINAPIGNALWPGNDYYGQFNQKLMIDPRYSNTTYLTQGNALWKSVNNGASYTSLYDFGTQAWRFIIARSKPDVIYLCTTGGIFKTTDAGSTWSQLSLPAGVAYQYYNTDITVNPLDENEVYFCMAKGTAANKVFKSSDGGASWINYTGTKLNNKYIAYLQFQGGTNGGVYAIAGSGAAQVFYRDNSMSDWIDFSSGFPQNFTIHGGNGALIFYRDSKIRVAGTRGVWESPLYSKGAPVAQPMADKQITSCSKDTVSFMDYSMDDYSNSTCSWSFPGASYVSCTNCRAPKVLYSGPGSYSVTLTVSDNQGNSNTKTVDKMILFDVDKCSPDTVAGKSLKMDGSQSISLGNTNINSNTFSISCWIQPYGNQSSFSQIISHNAYPGSNGFGFGLGFSFNGYNPNLNLSYIDGLVGYYNSTNLVADATKWNFVVLTYSPTGVKIYLNGVAADARTGAMPVIDLSQSPFYVNLDAAQGQGSAYKGEVDEIKFYNYTLSQDEIRAKMHLIQKPALEEAGLLKYIQFDQYDPTTGKVYDVVGGYNCSIPSSSFITNSTAPVATGVTYKMPNVNAGGKYSFTGTGMDLFFKDAATNPGIVYPNGDLVGFRLNAGPDQNPDDKPIQPNNAYFIVNNYGTNKTFSELDSIRFSNLNMNASPDFNPNNFRLFKRSSTAFGPTWGSPIDVADAFIYDPSASSLSYSSGNNITSFSQFVISSLKDLTSLPIKAPKKLNAVAQNTEILVTWPGLAENDLSYYELERSTDGRNFSGLAQVMPAANNSSYGYRDKDVTINTRYFYRLRCIGKDGSVAFSPITNAIIHKSAAYTLYPNPSKGVSYLDFTPGGNEKNLTISVFDISGKCVYRVNQSLQASVQSKVMLNLNGLSDGIYVVSLSTEIETLSATKLIIKK